MKLTEGINVYDDLDGTLGESSIKTTYRTRLEIYQQNLLNGSHTKWFNFIKY